MGTWGSSKSGERFTGTSAWKVSLEGFRLSLLVEGKTYIATVAQQGVVKIKLGFIWSSVEFRADDRAHVSVDGIPNGSATALAAAVRSALETYQVAERKRKKLEGFDRLLAPIVEWRNVMLRSIQAHRTNHRWIAEETLQS